MVVISACIYGVRIIKKFRWESGFSLGWFHGTPLMHVKKKKKIMISSLLEGIFDFFFLICKLVINFYMIK